MIDPPNEMTPNDLRQGGRFGWIAVVIVGAALCLRDVWLGMTGGGVTPGWLLILETAAWGAAAAGGTLVLSRPVDGTSMRGHRLKRWVVGAFSVAVVAHGIRVAFYLANRASS